jgi:hypothetical protein
MDLFVDLLLSASLSTRESAPLLLFFKPPFCGFVLDWIF